MINKFTEAHERMLAQLPVRTHQRYVREPKPNGKKRGPCGERPIIVLGRRFESLTKARKTLAIGMGRIYNLLDTGKARYL